jgi:hypothetical protein
MAAGRKVARATVRFCCGEGEGRQTREAAAERRENRGEEQKVGQSDGRDRCLDLYMGREERRREERETMEQQKSMKLEANVTKEIEQVVAEGWMGWMVRPSRARQCATGHGRLGVHPLEGRAHQQRDAWSCQGPGFGGAIRQVGSGWVDGATAAPAGRVTSQGVRVVAGTSPAVARTGQGTANTGERFVASLVPSTAPHSRLATRGRKMSTKRMKRREARQNHMGHTRPQTRGRLLRLEVTTNRAAALISASLSPTVLPWRAR